jgi:hypothetical protein
MSTRNSNNGGSSGGMSFFGMVFAAIAAFCSWTLNHSILWAVVHAFFGPFYLIYLCMGFGGGLPSLPW